MKKIMRIHEIPKTNKNVEQMFIKEDWHYFLISTKQTALLNNWLFPEVFYSQVYSISCKFS